MIPWHLRPKSSLSSLSTARCPIFWTPNCTGTESTDEGRVFAGQENAKADLRSEVLYGDKGDDILKTASQSALCNFVMEKVRP
jgi:hypothetical protein